MQKRLLLFTILVICSLAIGYYSVQTFFNASYRTRNNHNSEEFIQLDGMIVDSNKNPIIATITILNKKHKIIKRDINNLDGTFSIELQKGSYTILFSKGPEYKIIEKEIHLNDQVNKEDLNIILQREINLSDYNWYGGELHQHTKISDDGNINIEEVIANNLSRGLTFSTITDHNVSFDEFKNSPFTEHFVTLPGIEITTSFGDYNIYNYETTKDIDIDDYTSLKHQFEELKKNNAILQINHPFKEDNPFTFWSNANLFDTIEVWHGIYPYHHNFNQKAKDQWFKLLNQNIKLTPTCGSDNHYLDKLYLLNREETIYSDHNVLHSEVPMIYVHAESQTKEQIIKGLKNGNSYITNGPLILASLNDHIFGSEVPLNESFTLSVELIDHLGLNQLNIIKNGNIISTLELDDTYISLEKELHLNKGDYIVLEVLGNHNGYAITSPFYIN